MRPFADLGLDLRRKLTSAQKGQVSRYHKALFGGLDSSGEPQPGLIGNRDVRIQRTKTKAMRNQAEKHLYGKRLGLPKLKGVLVDSGSKVRFTKSGVVEKTKHVTKTHLYFDYSRYDGGDLTVFLVREAKRLIARRKEEHYQIKSGDAFVLQGVFTKEEVYDELSRKAGRYGSAKEWLKGLIALKYTNQKSLAEYLLAKEEKARNASRENRNRRKRERRAANKGLGKRAIK